LIGFASVPALSNHYRANSGFWTLAVALILFVLASANGIRIWWSSGPIVAVASLILIAVRTTATGPSSLGARLDWWDAFLPFVGLWAIAALLSASVEGSHSALLVAVFGYFTPFLLACALWRLPLTDRDHDILITALAAGLIIPMGHGLVEYLSEWGIPSLRDLFWSRYDLERMARYREVTFGSTFRTASLLVLAMPVIFSRLITPRIPLGMGLCLVIALVLGMCNLLIVQSRAAFAVILVILALATWRFKRPFLLLGLLSVIAAGAYAVTEIEELERVATHYSRGLQLDAESDDSLSVRLESIVIGWRLYGEHPLLGLGPGQSHVLNEHFIAHQIHVAQASELGTIGLAAMIGLTVIVLAAYLSLLTSERRATDYGFVWLSGSAAWIVSGTIANVPVAGTLLSTWGGLFACFTTLALNAMRGRSQALHRT